jgi:hypothetical protein
MDFYAVLDQVLALLRQRRRVSYRALKVQFHLDDEQLEAVLTNYSSALKSLAFFSLSVHAGAP